LKQENEKNKQQIADFETQIESLNAQILTLQTEKDDLLSSSTSVFFNFLTSCFSKKI